ncbi:MAG: secretin N-terminal domain-containing protein [Smithellaceae bacterium]|nr:secretin N-terminal domain-containing protein [Smithellaceae bacterium]
MPVKNISPGKVAPPAPAMPVDSKTLLPSGSAIPKNPQQTPQNPVGQSISTGHQPIQAVEPSSTMSPPVRGSVSLNFDDADIYSVIQTVFGEILKLNYIIDPRVKGRVTFRSVAPVAREKVMPLMEVILRLNGVAIIEESELYRIIPISDLSKEPSEIKIGRKILTTELKGKAVLQIVPLNYMQSSEIVKLINPFVSTNAVVVDVPKANHIIIADTDANVRRILQLIEYFDSEMKEKKGVRVFVHHVQNTNAKDLVAMLQQIYLGASAQTTDKAGKTVSPSPAASQVKPAAVTTVQAGGTEAIVSEATKIFADEKLNAVVILGTREDYDIIVATIKELDLIPRQVLIEGMIAQIQLTDKLNFGLAFAIKNKFLNFETFDLLFNPSTLSDVKTKGATAGGLSAIGIDSGGAVRLVINALATESKAKLLASPHIMVSDNNEARIQVGQQVPIPTSETYGSTVVAPQRTIQYKDIGIILKVKPMINDSGLVSLEIAQEVSDYSTIKLYSNEDQIILTKTEATTKLVVKDGQTIVIGGLIQETDKNAKAGLPWLVKIPIIGYLFGNTSKEKERTELVILLTPHIVKDNTDAVTVTDRFIEKFKDEKMSGDIQKNVSGRPKTEKEPVKKQ